MDTNAAAEHPAETAETPGSGPRQRSSALAERIVCPSRALLTGSGPLLGMSIREDGPLTGKPDAGNLLVRFGGRGGRNQPAFPTPIQNTSRIGTLVAAVGLLPEFMAASHIY